MSALPCGLRTYSKHLPKCTRHNQCRCARHVMTQFIHNVIQSNQIATTNIRHTQNYLCIVEQLAHMNKVNIHPTIGIFFLLKWEYFARLSCILSDLDVLTIWCLSRGKNVRFNSSSFIRASVFVVANIAANIFICCHTVAIFPTPHCLAETYIIYINMMFVFAPLPLHHTVLRHVFSPIHASI